MDENPPVAHAQQEVLERFLSAQRLMLDADRWLLSLDTPRGVEGRAPSQRQAARIHRRGAGPGLQRVRRVALTLPRPTTPPPTQEVIAEHPWRAPRLVVAHDPMASATKADQRNARLDELIRQANQWSG